ncbi:MAG: hypothetical protein IKR57_04270 [Bacilli bacterium]|nr:hypothetical protein [Bacilli bacterium]
MEYKDIKTPAELLEFMKNIKYGFVGDNGKQYYDANSKEWNDNWYEHAIVQNKDEVLNSMCGTCYEQVEFEREWFIEHGYKIKTYFIWFYVCRPNNIPSHTFLIYEKNNKYYLFEHADMNNMGIYEFDSEEEGIKYALDKHIKFVYSCNCDIKESERGTLKIYEYSRPKDDLHIQEFLDYVTKNEILIGAKHER